MIVQETVTINEQTYYKTYSDSGYLIHGGSPEGDYAEALDTVKREYKETATLIDSGEVTDEDYAAAGRILLGEADDGET